MRGLPQALDERGVRLSSTARAGAGATLARAHVHLVKPNMNEIVELAGEELAWPEGQADWASGLIAQGRSDIVLVTHGAEGALVVTGIGACGSSRQRCRSRARSAPATASLGGICAGLVRGQSVIEAGTPGHGRGSGDVAHPGDGALPSPGRRAPAP